MRWKYWWQLTFLIACLCFASIALFRAWALGAAFDAVFIALAMVYLGWVVVYVARQAHADWLCYALTGQRMPPRKPK